MNRTELALGISVVLFSVLAILVFFSNVTTVIIEPLGQRYRYATNAKWSLLFMALVVVVGISVAIRYGATRLGSIIGWAISLWSIPAFWWVILTLNETFFKKSLADELIWTSLPLIVFIFLGIALAVDGTRKPQTNIASTRNFV